MNLSDAQTALAQRGFDYLSDSQSKLMLNTGKDEFEDLYEWPWLQQRFNGPTPMLVADLKLILTVKASDDRELFGLDLRQAALGSDALTLPGTPDYWWIESAYTLHVWPGDGAGVYGVYIADSPPLIEPDDTPLIPARYHGMWIDFAVCAAYQDSDNFPAAQALRADVLVRMQDVIGRYETRNRQHSPFMTVRAVNGDD